MPDVKIPLWFFDELYNYHINDRDDPDRTDIVIRQILTEKKAAILAREEYYKDRVKNG